MKNFKKVIFGCSCILFLSISNVVLATTGTVTGKTVRIRESADSSSKIVTNAYRNDNVNVVEEQGDWYKVEYDGKSGYISKEYVDIKLENSDTQESNNESIEELKITKDSSLKLLPNFSSRTLGTISKGTEINIEQEVNNWVKISAGSNTGWILKNNTNINTVNSDSNLNNQEEINVDQENSESNVDEINNDEISSNQDTSNNYQNQTGYINIDTARVRETAGGKIIGNLDLNDQVTIIGEEGDWYKITCTEYESGYVSKKLVTIGTISSRSLDELRGSEKSEDENYLTEDQNFEESIVENEQNSSEIQDTIIEQQSNNADEIVNFAKSLLGCSYVSGGSGPNEFDCSGFTQYVYSKFGYSLARVASGQANNGVEVSRENLQPGDLLIFQDSGRTSIGHVGIYIGNGDFIHSANPSRGVVIDNLNSNSYYNIRFVCARRIV